MVVVDEGDAIAPQRPQPNEARMLGAAEDLVRRGGQRGIGTMFITQRSAVLNKNVLTQVQVLIALRTIAPQDLKAMDEWIDVHGEPDQRKTLMASLPSLPVGEAWVWSPGWPTEAGIFQRVKVAPIETFDSGATPKPGEKRVEPRLVSPVDMDRIRDLMADATQRDAGDDPKAMKKRIAELEKALSAGQAPAERVEVPMFDAELFSELERELTMHVNNFRGAMNVYRAKLLERNGSTGGLGGTPRPRPATSPEAIQPRPVETLRERTARISGDRDVKPDKSKLGAGERAILTAIAQHRDGATPELRAHLHRAAPFGDDQTRVTLTSCVLDRVEQAAGSRSPRR
jgi:hypothetical protein